MIIKANGAEMLNTKIPMTQESLYQIGSVPILRLIFLLHGKLYTIQILTVWNSIRLETNLDD